MSRLEAISLGTPKGDHIVKKELIFSLFHEVMTIFLMLFSLM